MPSVSICIPAYRQVRHLRMLLDSIVEQTWKDHEVIVSDDSPDRGVGKLVEEFASTIPGIRYVHHSPPLGSPRNWNHAISMASGTWIKLMHHDDRFARPDALGILMRRAIDEELDFVCSAAIAENERTGISLPHRPDQEEIDAIFQEPHRLLFANRIGPPSSVLFRRTAAPPFREDHQFLVDLEFYIAVLARGARAAYIPEPLIISVTGGAHNVTNSCFTREVELKESLETYMDLAPAFRSEAHLRRVSEHFTTLFGRYDISSAEELKALVPGLPIDAPMKKALSKAYRGHLLKGVKRRLARTSLYRSLDTARRDKGRVSHAQCGEDLIMDHLLTNLGIAKPFYVDIGAHDPYYLNNTAIFYERGARGVNIEPDPSLIRRFNKKRPQDVNLGIGLSDGPGTTPLPFHVFNVPTLNTFSKEEARRIEQEDPRYKVLRTIQVPVRNINDVLREYCADRRIDILSMDVEGLDEKLIRAIDYRSHSPLIICLETISYSAKGTGVKNEALIAFIREKGYLLYADTNINSIFVLEHIWKR